MPLTEDYIAERDEARRLIREAVELKGEDYVYESPTRVEIKCLYQTYDEVTFFEGEYRWQYGTPTGPSCIVGHVLLGAGVDPLVLKAKEGVGAFAVATERFDHATIRHALEEAQMVQDDGSNWGYALAKFEATITRYEESVARTDVILAGAV